MQRADVWNAKEATEKFATLAQYKPIVKMDERQKRAAAPKALKTPVIVSSPATFLVSPNPSYEAACCVSYFLFCYNQ
jgi:hypothetical protein